MSYMYTISERDKRFTYRKKIYRTPCNIRVRHVRENKELKKVLDDNDIIDYIVKSDKTTARMRHKVILAKPDGTVSLSNSVR